MSEIKEWVDGIYFKNRDNLERYKNLPEVELNRTEWSSIAHNGIERAASYMFSHKGETVRGNRSIAGVMIDGALTEYMIAKYFGVDYNWEIIDGGDGGCDLIINNKKVGVKSNRRNPAQLLVKEGKYDSEYYILVHFKAENIGKIMGYATLKEVKKKKVLQEPADIPNHIVDWKLLHPIS